VSREGPASSVSPTWPRAPRRSAARSPVPIPRAPGT